LHPPSGSQGRQPWPGTGKIDDEQIDRPDAGGFERGEVRRVVAPGEQPGVDFRMQRLDPAVEHFRKAGVGRDLGDPDRFLLQQLRRAAGGQKLDAARAERTCQLDDA